MSTTGTVTAGLTERVSPIPSARRVPRPPSAMWRLCPSLRQGHRAFACRRARVRWYACRFCRGDEAKAQKRRLLRSRLRRLWRLTLRGKGCRGGDRGRARGGARVHRVGRRAESAPAEKAAPALPQVTVLDASATQAILDNGRGYAQFCDMAVLAFASFTNPGGGYIQGYLAGRPRCAPIRTCTTYSTSSVSGTVRTVAATSTASCTVIVRWWCPRCASTATMCTPMPT